MHALQLARTHNLTAFVSVNLLTTFRNNLKHFIFNWHSLALPSNPLPRRHRFKFRFMALHKFIYLLTYLRTYYYRYNKLYNSTKGHMSECIWKRTSQVCFDKWNTWALSNRCRLKAAYSFILQPSYLSNRATCSSRSKSPLRHKHWINTLSLTVSAVVKWMSSLLPLGKSLSSRRTYKSLSYNSSLLKMVDGKLKDIRDGVLEDWPRPRGQNLVALALASVTPGLGLDHVVLEHIPERYTSE